MNELILKGKTTVAGMEVPNIEGGFGKGKKCMLAKDIARIHNIETRKINQTINRNKRKYNSNSLINVKDNSEFINELKRKGVMSQNAINSSKYIYILNEKGYMILNQTLEESSIAESVLENYFACDIKKYALVCNRKEILFRLSIQETLEGICDVIPQYNIKDYYIDIYIPKYNLAIEFDEGYHKNQSLEDKNREKEIKKELKCDFVRVDENMKLELGINKILKMIF